MSDIGILSDPFSIAILLILLGSPGIPIGAAAGALLWRNQRMLGAGLGALGGFGVWLLGWLYFSGNL